MPLPTPSRSAPRRRFLRATGQATAALAAVALALTGCSTGPASPTAADAPSQLASSAFPVTIQHVFGETIIEE